MNRIEIAHFSDEYAPKISNLIIRNFMEINIKDYSLEEMQELSKRFMPDDIIAYSKWRHVLVALHDGICVGTAGIAMLPPNNENGEYWIMTVFVIPEYHRQGIGRALIEHIEEYAKSIGAKKLTIPSGITACDFYDKLGYRYKNNKKELDSDGNYLMEKCI